MNKQKKRNIIPTYRNKNTLEYKCLKLLGDKAKKIFKFTKNEEILVSYDTSFLAYDVICTAIQTLFKCNNQEITNKINTEKAYKLDQIFEYHNFIKNPIKLQNIKTDNAIHLEKMFKYAIFSNDNDIKHFKINNVIDTTSMFEHVNKMNFDLSQWIPENIKYMTATFSYIKEFKGNIEGWKLPKLHEFDNTFEHSNQNINFQTWEIPYNIKDMVTAFFTFSNCKKQTNSFKNFNFTNIQNSIHMFPNTQKIIPNTPNFYNMYDTNIKEYYFSILNDFIKNQNLIIYLKKYITTEKKTALKKYFKTRFDHNDIIEMKYIKNYYTYYKKL